MNCIYDILIIISLKITIVFSTNDLELVSTAPSSLNTENYYTEDELEKHGQFLHAGQDLDYDDFPENPYKEKGDYPCLRHCGRNFKPELCYYKFEIERHQTFSKHCYRNTFSTNKFFDDGCVTADGTKMRITTVNKMLPGTAIHICQGDTLVVDVQNLLPGGRSVSIHWHGIKHPHSQWMDGVSFLTQCPIESNQTFRYEFKALEAGTFFYHASDNELHVSGLAGPLIIRSKQDSERNDLYNSDVYSHTILIQDLMHEKDDLKFPFTDDRGRFLSPSSYLINGRGQYKEKIKLGFSRRTDSPLAEFWVEELAKFRFRIIAATNSSCSFRFAIEKHSLTVIAADGNPIKPVKVGTIYMHAGERLDVVIDAFQKVSSYWIRVKGNDLCSSARQSAILHYRGTRKKVPSSKRSRAIFTQFTKTLPDLNNFSLGCRNTTKNLCWQNLRPEKIILDESLSSGVVELIKIEAARIKLVNRVMATSPVSKEKFDLVFGKDYLEDTETFNKISCQLPPVAILKQFQETLPETLKCRSGQDSKIKKCFYVIELKLHEVIDILFVDATHIDLPEKPKQDVLLSYDRSIHFHGHNVFILEQGTLKDFKNRRQNPFYSESTIPDRILKDTVSIPKDGYTIIRFKASNPGIWALKTPVTDGNGEGVALAFQVGGKDFTKSGIHVPSSLPKCNNYLPPVKKLSQPTEENVEVDIFEHAGRGNEASSSYKYSPGRSVADNVVEGILWEMKMRTVQL